MLASFCPFALSFFQLIHDFIPMYADTPLQIWQMETQSFCNAPAEDFLHVRVFPRQRGGIQAATKSPSELVRILDNVLPFRVYVNKEVLQVTNTRRPNPFVIFQSPKIVDLQLHSNIMCINFGLGEP